jgi:hypothetical protein
VEFSGPRNDNVIVKLIDGTAFSISDVVESLVDPRSPLKIANICEKTKFQQNSWTLKPFQRQIQKRKRERERGKALCIAKDEELRQAELAALEVR